ncbi:MAG TPA: hypothetical protein DIW61_12020 [Candidatus Aminicenantes bacterium]|jgi:rubrerythrin|nr:hypothetical protein [Candidatus Aminicenantes bacterium]
MTLTETLDEAILLEEEVFSCYDFLSKITQDGAAEDIRKLAREERSHINVLATGKNFVLRTPDLFGKETMPAAEIREGIKSACRIRQDLEKKKITVKQALERLSELEQKFEKIHMNTAVEFKDYSLKKLFEALARADAEHRQRLERLVAQL